MAMPFELHSVQAVALCLPYIVCSCLQWQLFGQYDVWLM
jgi:hypothetical protein